MKITVNITDNNKRVLERQLRNYNLMNGTDMTIDQFKEIVFINGLMTFANRIDVRVKRSGEPYCSLMGGEIVEYR